MNSAKAFTTLGVVVAINLGLQLLFQWYIIVSFGAGMETDAFFGTMAVPQFVLLVLGSSSTMVLMPLLSSYTGNEFSKESWNYFQAIGLLFVTLAILLLITAQWWVAWLLPGLTEAGHQLALQLTRVQLIGMVFSALLSVLWAVNSAAGKFLMIEISSIVANVIAFILLIFVTHIAGIYAAAWVSILRIAMQVIFLMNIMGRYQKPDFRSLSFKESWKKFRPLIAGNTYFKTDVLIDKNLTSFGPAGELTMLNLAQQLYSAGNAVLSKVLVNTMVPEMSRAATGDDKKKYGRLLQKRLWISFLSTAIVSLLIIVLGKWVLGIVFSFKHFDIKDVADLWWLLLLLSGYWIGALMGGITSASFYARGDTVTPTKIGAIMFTLYIPVKIFCYYRYGLAGLAVSISAYYIASFLVQLFFLRKWM